MVEAMEHFISFPNDASYKNRMVTKDMLANHEYKEAVHMDAGAVRKTIDFKTKGAIDNVIAMNLVKAKYILTGDYSRVKTVEEYRAIDCEQILKEQAEMYAKIEQFYVLCTCVFYVLDFDETKYFVS